MIRGCVTLNSLSLFVGVFWSGDYYIHLLLYFEVMTGERAIYMGNELGTTTDTSPRVSREKLQLVH